MTSNCVLEDVLEAKDVLEDSTSGYYHLKKDWFAFRHYYITMSIERPIIKKSYVICKKSLNALCEKRLQSSMFKWTSFHNFMEFHCKILNSYATYRCKKIVKILNCYLFAKKSYGTLSKVAIFFWPTQAKPVHYVHNCLT